jgi:hypothetical protein
VFQWNIYQEYSRLVATANGGGSRRRNSRSSRSRALRLTRVAGVLGVLGGGASSARNLDGLVLDAGHDSGVLLGDGLNGLRRNALLGLARDGSRRDDGLSTALGSGRSGVDGRVRDGAVTGLARLLGSSRRLSGLGLGRRSGRLLRLSGSLRLLGSLGGLGLLRLLGSLRLLRLTRSLGLLRLLGSLGLLRLTRSLGLLRGLRLLRLARSLGLAGLLAATGRLDGADGGRDGNGLGNNNGGATSGGAVGDLGTARGDGLDVGRVDGRGGHGSLSGGRSLRSLGGSGDLRDLVGLSGVSTLLSRGDLGRDGVRSGADNGGSGRAVGDLRTARGDGNVLGLVDLGNLVVVGHGTRGQESSGSSRVTHLGEFDCKFGKESLKLQA